MSGACRQKPSTPPRNRWNTAEQLSYQLDPAGLGVLVIPEQSLLCWAAPHATPGGAPPMQNTALISFPFCQFLAFLSLGVMKGTPAFGCSHLKGSRDILCHLITCFIRGSPLRGKETCQPPVAASCVSKC